MHTDCENCGCKIHEGDPSLKHGTNTFCSTLCKEAYEQENQQLVMYHPQFQPTEGHE